MADRARIRFTAGTGGVSGLVDDTGTPSFLVEAREWTARKRSRPYRYLQSTNAQKTVSVGTAADGFARGYLLSGEVGFDNVGTANAIGTLTLETGLGKKLSGQAEIIEVGVQRPWSRFGRPLVTLSWDWNSVTESSV